MMRPSGQTQADLPHTLSLVDRRLCREQELLRELSFVKAEPSLLNLSVELGLIRSRLQLIGDLARWEEVSDGEKKDSGARPHTCPACGKPGEHLCAECVEDNAPR